MDLAITASAAFLMTAGLTANVGPALQIGGGLRYDWLSLDLELRSVFPSLAHAREAVDPSKATVPTAFDLSQLSAELVPCLRFATYFAGCGVVGTYTFIKQDYSTVFAPGWLVGPRFGAEVPIGERFALFAFAEALFYPQPDAQRYVLPSAPGKADENNVLWRSSPVSGYFGAGVLVKFE
jgi:hypothetical protein